MRIARLASMIMSPWIVVLPQIGCSSYGDDCRNTNTCTSGGDAAGAEAIDISAAQPSSGSGGRGTGGESSTQSGGSGVVDGGAPSGTGGATATGGSATSGGSTGTGGAVSECDPSLAPSVDVCVVSDAYGVFVSPLGDDASGDGTKAHPVQTIAQGMTLARSEGKRVYVCADLGSYAETLTLGSALDGLEIFGGFACADFAYSPEAKTRVESPTAEAAVLEDLTTGVTLEDFEIQAADASVPGGSSFGMVVRNSSGVVLRRVVIGSGNGAAGSAGQAGLGGADGELPGEAQAGLPTACSTSINGAVTSQDGGAWEGASACGSLGGTGGGSRLTAGADGESGTPQANVVDPGLENGGEGGAGLREDGQSGTSGSVGLPGAAASAASEVGSFAESGYLTADGQRGGDGSPGQGGGGGGAAGGSTQGVTQACIGATGGAGGMGGCGGGGGSAGGGGGASVALFAWQSTVTLDTVTLVAQSGGDGGTGGNASPGGAGGPGASAGESRTGSPSAGDGGDGGNGGDGAPGSGGTGGPSFGLVYSGTVPSVEGTSVSTPGSGGLGGPGGVDAADTIQAPSGSDGQSAQMYAVP